MNGFSFSDPTIPSPIGTMYNLSPLNTVNTRLQIANARAGIATRPLLAIGDSITLGYYGTHQATAPYLDGWAYDLVKPSTGFLNVNGIPASIGLITPQYTGVAETRITLGTGWTIGNNLSSSFNYANFCTSALPTTGSLTVNPAASAAVPAWDTAVCYFVQASGAGNAICTATGGTAVTQSCNGSSGITVITCTASAASATNTLSITGSVNVGSNLWFLGADFYNSASPALRLGNMGIPGISLNEWTERGGGSTTPYDQYGLVEAVNPAAAAVCLGMNDSQSPAIYMAEMQSLITFLKGLGTTDVFLIAPPPGGTVGPANLGAYVGQLYALAQANNVPLYDWYNRFGGVQNSSFTQAGGGVHPNNAGHWDAAAHIGAFFLI